MRRLAPALLLSALALRAGAAPLTPGTVFETKKGGRLVIVDKDGRREEYRVRRDTKVFRDGKKADFEHELIGDVVIRGRYDPKTKILKVLELKTSTVAAPPVLPPAGPAKGEVALADAIKGTLSVRVGNGITRDFSVTAATKVLALSEGNPSHEVLFETVAVGDSVEVRSADGKTADEIRVRPSAR